MHNSKEIANQKYLETENNFLTTGPNAPEWPKQILILIFFFQKGQGISKDVYGVCYHKQNWMEHCLLYDLRSRFGWHCSQWKISLDEVL